MIIHEFEEKNFDNEIKDGIVLIDFFATWCGPCKMLAPELEGLSKDMNNVKIIKVDIDKYPTLTNKYRVMSVPTLLLYNNGEVVGNRSGYMPLNILKDWINESVR